MTDKPLFNIYIDETCHLENDVIPIMAFGATWCPKSEARILSQELREIKKWHLARGELKWSKVSPSKLNFYIELIDWFIDKKSLNFRGLVVQNKHLLNHQYFNQNDHDLFYYKMLFSLLNKMLSPDSRYDIYLDIKDTRSRNRLKSLKEVLSNDKYDFTSEMIHHLQNTHSDEMELMQVTDFLIGAIGYRHRNLPKNTAKFTVIEHLENRIGRSLFKTTALTEQKLNLFVFQPQRV